MYFLFDPIGWIKEGVMGAIEQGIRTLCFSLSTIIYKLVINLYNLFELLCTARLLDSDIINQLSTRIGLILGLVMFFNVAISFIKMLIEPDSINDKEKGAVAIIKKALIVIVLLGTSQFAFDTLYSVQRTVIKNHVISNLLLPYKINEDDLNNFGSVLSEELMYSFYQMEDFEEAENIDPDDQTTIDTCNNMVTAFRNQIIKQNRFDLGYNCLNESVTVDLNTGGSAGTQSQDIFVINYNWAICVLAGVVVAYLLLMYCLKVGVRMVQLMFLEIISPMAFVSYLSPKKDTMFSKWTKIYVSTYIDVFIRMAIINFVIFLIAAIFTSEGIDGFMFWTSVGNPSDLGTRSFFLVVIILALLTFAKKAPDLLKELIGSSASKLGFGASMKDIVGLQKGVKIGASILGGAAGGAAIGLIGGGLGGLAGGLLKGGLSGFKGQGIGKTATSAWKNQVASNKRIKDWRADGGGPLPFGRWGAAFNQWRGADTVADKYDREKADIEAENTAYNQLAGYFDAAKKRAESKIKEGKYKGSSTGQIAANAALQAEQRIEILKAQAGNLNKSSATYRSDMRAIQSEIARHQKAYNRAMDEAVKEFINTGHDVVVDQNMDMARGVIDNNSSFSGFAGVTVTDFATFESANNAAKAAVATNTTRLAQNKREGERARANAKYSGRGK